MKRFFSGFVTALFILTFVTCIYSYGTNRRFSLEQYLIRLNSISTASDLEGIRDAWTTDGYAYTPSGSSAIIYTTYEDYDGENEILEFFDGVRGFFRRLGRTFNLIGQFLKSLLENFDLLIPWNAVEYQGAGPGGGDNSGVITGGVS